MSKKKLSKLLAICLPYVVIGLLATNLGEAWRLAVQDFLFKWKLYIIEEIIYSNSRK